MTKRFLLTSFDIWLPNQSSNSSDNLLELVIVTKLHSIPYAVTWLRKLPVDIPTAASQVIAKIDETQPDYIICCGMAESRLLLSVESNARSTALRAISSTDNFSDYVGETKLEAIVNLEQLVLGATALDISHDCGLFVCEGLYYSVLEYLLTHSIDSPCIFVHVPILTEENSAVILEDFLLIIHRLALS
jgi:pyroglutamyl-peptidase